jgi:hypothetical protein
VRPIFQAGLYPSNCRILDPAEAYNNRRGRWLLSRASRESARNTMGILGKGAGPLAPFVVLPVDVLAFHIGLEPSFELAQQRQ